MFDEFCFDEICFDESAVIGATGPTAVDSVVIGGADPDPRQTAVSERDMITSVVIGGSGDPDPRGTNIVPL
jgi:hypothetical protein